MSKFNGYLTVFGGVCLHLVCGNLYLWGNISNYAVSYYHFLGDENATLTVATGVLPIGFTLLAFMFPFGAWMMKKTNPKFVIALGATIMLSAILIASYIKSWWGFVICYGAMFPLGIGIVYWTPIICAWEWFPERKGLVGGLIISAFGFGAFFFGFYSTWIVNPEDAKTAHMSGTKDKLFPKL